MPKLINSKSTKTQKLALLIAPLISLAIILFVDLDAENKQVTYCLAIALLMAIWWITEAIPLAVTALLPVALFPIFGVVDGKSISAMYFNHLIFLFIGGFLMAFAMERWNLHRRIALRILLLFGISPGRILLGFMLATSFLSMWMSNTATAMMMVPIALSIIMKLEESLGEVKMGRYSVGLLLGIAYSASVGGIATLVGTPPNLSFARIVNIVFPEMTEISFADWFIFAIPVTILLFVATWLLLYFMYKPKESWQNIQLNEFKKEYKALGKAKTEEKIVLVLFTLLAFLWIFRSGFNIQSFVVPGWSKLFNNPSYINDGTVAIFISIILFIIPSKTEKGERIMNWETAKKVPWNIVLLFGGGFALAQGFVDSGLSVWFGEQLAGLAITNEINPLLLMIPATLAASLAFMLPVATPPNAIVFGTNRIRVKDMVRTGILLNITGIIIATLVMYFWGTLVFDIDVSVFPDWAAAAK